MVVLACNPSTQEWRQEDQKDKDNLGCMRPYLAKKNNKTNKQTHNNKPPGMIW